MTNTVPRLVMPLQPSRMVRVADATHTTMGSGFSRRGETFPTCHWATMGSGFGRFGRCGETIPTCHWATMVSESSLWGRKSYLTEFGPLPRRRRSQTVARESDRPAGMMPLVRQVIMAVTKVLFFFLLF